MSKTEASAGHNRVFAAASAVAAVTAGLAVAGCGSTEYVVDGGKLQKSISTELASKGLSVKSVKCPSGTQISKGLKVHCTVVLTDGESEQYLAVFTTAKGRFEARPADEIATFIEKELEQELRASGVNATASCPQHVAIVVGKSFTCTLTASNGQRATVKATMIDLTGGIRLGKLQTG